MSTRLEHGMTFSLRFDSPIGDAIDFGKSPRKVRALLISMECKER